jgi:mycothiol synthase
MMDHLHAAAGRRLTSRPYAGEDDLLQMRGLLMEGRARTGDWRYAHVGELAWSYFMVACHLDPQQHIRLWHDGDGQLAGFAILGEDPTLDWQVSPDHELSGIEAEALAWAEERVAGLREQDAARWGGPLAIGARQDDARRIAFLEQHGFGFSGEFAEVNMIRSLGEPIPEAALPDGFQVRSLVDGDEVPGRASAHREVWQPWTVGNVGDEDYAAFMRLPGYQRELDVVAVTPSGGIAAYVNCWLDPVNRIGDFGPVGARRAYRRRGLTRAVLLEGMRRLQAAGMDRVCVSTGVSNTAARRMYESVGLAEVNRYQDYDRA